MIIKEGSVKVNKDLKELISIPARYTIKQKRDNEEGYKLTAVFNMLYIEERDDGKKNIVLTGQAGKLLELKEDDIVEICLPGRQGIRPLA